MRFILIKFYNIKLNYYPASLSIFYFSKAWINFFKEAFLFDYIQKFIFINFINIWVFYNIILTNNLVLNLRLLRFYNYFCSNLFLYTKELFTLNWFKSFYYFLVYLVYYFIIGNFYFILFIYIL